MTIFRYELAARFACRCFALQRIDKSRRRILNTIGADFFDAGLQSYAVAVVKRRVVSKL
jgi:hypothetical protein